MSVEVADQNGPPSLNYDLRARFASNVSFWSSIVVTLTIIPIVLFYPLYHFSTLSLDIVLSIATISTALPSVFQLPYRIWKLWKQDQGDRRPLSGNIMDLFMWEYVISFIILTVVYTVSTSIPIPALFLMTPSILVGNVVLQFLLSLSQIRVPIWLSSLPPGHKMRPGGYYIMEDVVAVDGGGRSAFRKALNMRYERSPIFRKLVREMTIYWTIGGLLFVGVNAALTFTTTLDVAFGATLGWIPVWALLWFLPARLWVQRRLTQEKESFRTNAQTLSSE